MRIDRFDPNFAVKKIPKKAGKTFYAIDQPPFSLHGVFYEDGQYRRMPADIAKSVSEGVFYLHTNTAGGRVRFATNSPSICIHAKMGNVGKMPHFALTGSIGFDLHTGKRYAGSFIPPFDIKHSFDSEITLPEDLRDGKMHDFTLHFPLYSDVKALYIGIADGSTLSAAKPYTYETPVVYYGSSITQGGCASRPGNAYENIVSYELDCDHINLGFSGNARAEDTMIDFIASLSMSVFVYDYDHNAPTAEHLRKTHEKLFKAVRAKQPDLPVVFMTRPQPYLNTDECERLNIVRTTYENAVAAGDKNVYFLPGNQLLDEAARNTGLVDNCHPNDSGFVSMAKAVKNILAEIFEKL